MSGPGTDRAAKQKVALARLRPARIPGIGDAAAFLRHLRSATRMSALRALIDGVGVTWTLKRHGVRPLLARADSTATTRDADRAIEVAATVDAALGLLPIAPTCLRRSMTLMRELSRLGLAAALHIGVRTGVQDIEAHAWVQVGDVVVNDEPALISTYTELASGELETLLPLLR